MPEQPEQDRRVVPDRRHRPTTAWGTFRSRGRRLHNRRAGELCLPYFTDRFPLFPFVLTLVLLVATIADGVLTLHLIATDCREINPLMSYLLGKGFWAFFLGKYLLTGLGLFFLLIFKNYPLFGTRFRVGHLIPIFAVLYFALLSYQIYLFHGRLLS